MGTTTLPWSRKTGLKTQKSQFSPFKSGLPIFQKQPILYLAINAKPYYRTGNNGPKTRLCGSSGPLGGGEHCSSSPSLRRTPSRRNRDRELGPSKRIGSQSEC